MLKILRLLLSVFVIVLGSYSLITKNFEFISYMLLAVGVLSLVTGSLELKAKRKTSAIISFLAAAFLIFVFIYTYGDLRYNLIK